MHYSGAQPLNAKPSREHAEREFCIINLLARIQFIIEIIRWTGFAPWEFPRKPYIYLAMQEHARPHRVPSARHLWGLKPARPGRARLRMTLEALTLNPHRSKHDHIGFPRAWNCEALGQLGQDEPASE